MQLHIVFRKIINFLVWWQIVLWPYIRLPVVSMYSLVPVGCGRYLSVLYGITIEKPSEYITPLVDQCCYQTPEAQTF